MTLSGLTGVMQEPHSFARGDRNLGFDLHWLFRETSCRPAFVYDTLLLARQCQPELLLGLNHVAAVGPEREQEEAIELLTGAGEKGGGSLEYLSTIVGLPRPNKAHQKPANWVVSVLSPEHFDYAMADINNPLAIIWHMFGTANPQKLRPRLERKFRWYAHYQTALVKHACLRDMPFDREIGAKIKHRYTQACRAVANRFRRSWPDICNEEVAAILADPAKGTAKPVKQAFAALAASKGIELPTTETGEVSTSLKDWRYRGIDQSFPEFYTLRKKLSDYKKGVETIESLEEFSRKDGSVYPMVCFSTAAGRASSQNPNVQGFLRERRLRRAFGRRGYKVVKTDYSSIELRIGASLANRALAETRKHLAHVRNLHDFEDSDYFLRNAWVGMQCKSVDITPESAPEGWSADDWRMERPARLIRYFANRTRRLDSQCLETIFRHRVDPHLVTGLDDGAARRADRDRGRHCPMAAGARKTRN